MRADRLGMGPGMGLVVLVVAAAAPAGAEPGRVHGSASAGGALLGTGDRGDRARLEAAADVEVGRFGAIAAWRAFDDHHRGLVMAGLIFEAAAARPRLVLGLHADLGADLDARAPLAGGGIRTVLAIAGPLGAAFDAGAYLIIDGVDGTRLQLQTSASLSVRW